MMATGKDIKGHQLDIPKGWVYVKLDDVAERATGHTPDKTVTSYWNGGIKWVSLADSNKLNCPFIFGTDKEISEEGIRNSSARLLPSGTVVLLRDAGVGRSSILATEMAVSQHFVAWICGERINNRFLYQYLQARKSFFERMAVGSTIVTIGMGLFRKLMIPLPPRSEQEKIADSLALWDRAIDLTERLLAEKRMRRKGLMQQLLTGKRRLPGFAGKWRKVRLGNIFHNRTESARPDLPLVSIAGDRGVIPRDDINRKDSSSEDKSKYLLICPGDIGYNTMRMWQGVSGLSAIEGIVSPAYTILTPKQGIDAEFMAILFKFQPVVHLFYRHSQGMVSDTWNLKFRHFAKIKVSIPSEDEQQAIAKVFRTLNRELDLLQAKADTLRAQKKGLMQQLLTGKKRVKV